MPYHYQIDPTMKTGFVRMTGYVDADAFNAAADAMLNDALWQSDYNSLWDLRATAAVDITPEGLRSLVARKAERDTTRGLSGKIAVVASREVVLVAAQVASVRSRSSVREVQVFTGTRLAFRWLGLPDDVEIPGEDGQRDAGGAPGTP